MKIPHAHEWVETQHEINDTTLLIMHRKGDEGWQQFGIDYWRDHLKNLKEFRKSRDAIVHVGKVGDDPKDYFFKRLFIRQTRFDAVKHMIRDSRGRRALIQGELLKDKGFNTAKAVCLIEEKKGGRIRESGLITEALANCHNLQEWLFEPHGEQKKNTLIKAYAREVGSLHREGIFHGDLRKSNVLFQSNNKAYCFYLLDNERNQQYASLPDGRRIHNLVRINMEKGDVTWNDRMRFWKAYVESAELPESQHRRILKKVIQKTRQRWRQRGWL